MASDRIAAGQVIAQRYRVERQLGKGGMGSVFLVTHVHTDEHLALKILHSAVISDAVALERFRREARTPARINSDHVVRVTDADVAEELGDAPFLVMEYLRGEDLEQRSTRLGPLQPEEVIVYLRQVARALDKAHSLGIVHRDLKPENLFLITREDGTPCVKILDFGIAKLIGEASRQLVRAAATSTGQIFGTPLYMAPEQAKGEASKISPQTDIWSLGLIAHRLLTGTEIWTAETITHLIAQIAYEPMPVPSEHGVKLGQAYDEWFAVCCARDVETRYPTAGDAIRALGRAFDIEDSYIGLAPVGPRIDIGTGRFQIGAPISEPSASGLKAAEVSALQNAATLALTPSSPAGPVPSSLAGSSRSSPSPAPLKMSAGPLTRSTDMKLGDVAPRRARWLGIAAVLGASVAALAMGVVWWSKAGVPDTSPASQVTAPVEPPIQVVAPADQVVAPPESPATVLPLPPPVPLAPAGAATPVRPAIKPIASSAPPALPPFSASAALPVSTPDAGIELPASSASTVKPPIAPPLKKKPTADPLSGRH
jgi:serine/threonine-protein kinase